MSAMILPRSSAAAHSLVGGAGELVALHGDRAVQHPGQPGQRLLQVVGGIQHDVDHAQPQRVLRLHHPVLVERVLDDDGDRVLRPGDPREQLGAAPAGQDAEEDLGQATCRPRWRRASGSRSAAPVPCRRRGPAPLTKAKVGIRRSPQPAEHPVARAPRTPRRSARSATDPTWDRSAPAAKMNGLPVTAMASGPASIAVLIAASRLARPSGPRVFGRVWSRPLSRVISATVTDPPGAAGGRHLDAAGSGRG